MELYWILQQGGGSILLLCTFPLWALDLGVNVCPASSASEAVVQGL